MTRQEQRIYNLEHQLIRKYFIGVRARPVKMVKDSDFDGKANEPHMLINRRLLGKKFTKELENLLKHELIHYELKDKGKDYYGHGAAFLKRAAELGIVGTYELDRCFSLEEYEHPPTRRKTVHTPLKKVKENIDQEINRLHKLVMGLPDRQKIELYRKIQNLQITWAVYSGAVEAGEKFIREEHWEKRKGPRGKGRVLLRKEFHELKAEHERLWEEFRSRPNDLTLRRKLLAVERKMDRILQKVESDYGYRL